MSSSVLASDLVLRLKRFPTKGRSPNTGILLSESASDWYMRPPMMTVWPSGVTTTVSALRELMSGALTELEMGTHCERSATSSEVSGERIISTRPLARIKGVTRRIMPTLV